MINIKENTWKIQEYRNLRTNAGAHQRTSKWKLDQVERKWNLITEQKTDLGNSAECDALFCVNKWHFWMLEKWSELFFADILAV